jgi:[ribosomal protein S5]-alanine N-acetyltransferase
MSIATTARLRLRHLRPEDLGALMAVFADPEVMRFSAGMRDEEQARSWLREVLEEHYPIYGYGPYAVVEGETDAFLGYCGLFACPELGEPLEVELGYRLARRAWGRGYATEAATAVRDYAFATLGLTRLVALIDPANTASLRVAQKLGMAYEREVMLPGYDHADHLYALHRR